jgi:hypothetical protein
MSSLRYNVKKYMAAGVSQVIECLPCKREALSSKLQYHKKIHMNTRNEVLHCFLRNNDYFILLFSSFFLLAFPNFPHTMFTSLQAQIY